MIYLALSILCSTSIALIFRAFPKYNIQSFQAIVFNYLVCGALALIVAPSNQLSLIPNWSGLYLTIGLGTFFVFLFYMIARTTQLLGVAVASVAQKLSFIVPVIVGILVFQEGASFLKILGVILGILAVFLISKKNNKKNGEDAAPVTKMMIRNKSFSPNILLPIAVFLGSGLCDLTVNIIQTKHIGEVQTATFTLVLFSSAFIAGIIRLAYSKVPIKKQNILAGFILGVPNFGSVYFLVLSLKFSGLESSQVFPINNVGIILVAALMAWLIYKERLIFRQLIGLAIALAAILILI
ncbi:MAG: EamA family transporter [Chitinophagales bacterium]